MRQQLRGNNRSETVAETLTDKKSSQIKIIEGKMAVIVSRETVRGGNTRPPGLLGRKGKCDIWYLEKRIKN